MVAEATCDGFSYRSVPGVAMLSRARQVLKTKAENQNRTRPREVVIGGWYNFPSINYVAHRYARVTPFDVPDGATGYAKDNSTIWRDKMVPPVAWRCRMTATWTLGSGSSEPQQNGEAQIFTPSPAPENSGESWANVFRVLYIHMTT